MSIGHIKCATKNSKQLFLNTSLIVIMFYQWKLGQQDAQLKIYSIEALHVVVLWQLIKLCLVVADSAIASLSLKCLKYY